MILITDVYYPSSGGGWAAGLSCLGWGDAVAQYEHTAFIEDVAEYQPGQFYLRELPCLLKLVSTAPVPPSIVVVDGHAWLNGKPGLGAKLHGATGLPVVGVAKRPFFEGAAGVIFRQNSKNPLYVSAAGLDVEDALKNIESMHGPYRIPTLLKRADSLCRQAAQP